MDDLSKDGRREKKRQEHNVAQSALFSLDPDRAKGSGAPTVFLYCQARKVNLSVHTTLMTLPSSAVYNPRAIPVFVFDLGSEVSGALNPFHHHQHLHRKVVQPQQTSALVKHLNIFFGRP